MKKSLLLCTALACFAVLASGPGALAADNWVGTWKLNLAKSKYSGWPAPKSSTLKFEATPDGIKATTDRIDADGKALHREYSSRFDGQEVAWTGNPDADTAMARRIDDNSYENVWKKDGKATVTSHAVVSKDGKTLTITQTGKDAKGRTVTATAVYDRQ